LTDSESEDVVQETLLGIAKSLPGFEYDPARCSFKTWLLSVTRRKIADLVRHRAAELPYLPRWETGSNDGASAEHGFGGAGNEDLDVVWEEEWRQHVTEAALERLKATANPKHFQAFYLHVIKGQSGAQVARALDIHLAQVYIIKHRLLPAFRKVVSVLEAELR
jgi:RNA polymerase sigma-70 factor (ECF subfamily)